MQVFLFEFITGGGLAGCDLTGSDSLLREGRAMIEAVAADFAALPDVDVCLLRDARLPPLATPCVTTTVESLTDLAPSFRRAATNADWTLVIAPEIDGELFHWTNVAERCGAKLVSPSLATIELASDKHRTAQALAAAGVPVPRGVRLESGQPLPVDFSYPAILKPNDGAGSQGVERINSGQSAIQTTAGARRLESLIPGIPVSVAVVCGPRGAQPLPACLQRLEPDRFAYQGGEAPLPDLLAARAERLALAAVTVLPDLRGYLGVDLVLGEAFDGSADVVIEINPRLTTSYVGLRRLSRQNLAAAMLDAAEGRPEALSFHSERLEFDADGAVRMQGEVLAERL